MSKLTYVIIYLAIINLVSFIAFFSDKQKSKKDKWRIKEKTLHTYSFMGGVFGSILAMVLFHHKTRKPEFVIITFIALILTIFLLYKISGILF